MSNQKSINRVTIKKVGKSLEFHIPTNMNGASLIAWKKANKAELDAFVSEKANEETNEEKSEVP